MSIFEKLISDIVEADLLALVTTKEMEGKSIEYKRDRVGQADNDKKEFLYDVSSFANSAGGHIVFGIEALDGVPVAIPGLVGTNPGDEITRLTQILRDGVRPQIMGVQIVSVRLQNGNVALVLRIPKSWNPPHQVTYQKAFRFYGRDTNSKYQIDVDELRSIFVLSEGVAEKTRLFRIDRIAKLVAADTPVPVESGAKMVTHIVPLSAFTTNAIINLESLWRDPTYMVRMMGGGGSHRYNVDGLIFAPAINQICARYVQVFRNGCIEVVESFSEEANRRRSLPNVAFETDILGQVSGSRQLFLASAVSPPIVIMLTMVGMKGWRMGVNAEYDRHHGTFDRDPLFIPELVLETLGGTVDEQVKPLLDMVWNAAGWPASINYDARGKRTPSR